MHGPRCGSTGHCGATETRSRLWRLAGVVTEIGGPRPERHAADSGQAEVQGQVAQVVVIVKTIRAFADVGQALGDEQIGQVRSDPVTGPRFGRGHGKPAHVPGNLADEPHQARQGLEVGRPRKRARARLRNLLGAASHSM